jgi:hypothetical protein
VQCSAVQCSAVQCSAVQCRVKEWQTGGSSQHEQLSGREVALCLLPPDHTVLPTGDHTVLVAFHILQRGWLHSILWTPHLAPHGVTRPAGIRYFLGYCLVMQRQSAANMKIVKVVNMYPVSHKSEFALSEIQTDQQEKSCHTTHCCIVQRNGFEGLHPGLR